MRKKRCEIEFRKSKEEIKYLKHLHSIDYIDLYFGDASHFSTVPNVPYAWQTKDDPVLLPSDRSKSWSVLGLMTPCSKLFQRTYEGSVNSQIMIDFLDEFCEKITKKTVIILDNAPIHKSKIFTVKVKEWEERDLIIYFIPPYSPELNLIEILWRFVKYQWLPFDAFTNFVSLKKHLNEILDNFGSKYMINFS
ncbi:IS630 family transposase [Chryseobacterium sp. Ch-15]|uniref:IS630 family transposase n=1 Tax=Chryseobacterium muglaense TaxID=2893752 RepID=A0A9Q3UQY2_9FLAO|nr:IS630 family transposase [Chryseobacterium muglaense]MCC9033009.1 IS630 family transposase [Chryseobacterium muglaense]MCC9033514.1 IS630 family transposase [Chryseobacterium muglaense]MCC9033979.1 IS630 family transposase [Chryseobacterium muglaense]MCC9035280.1 IS630 family transposase [Chryseobacterium muglaense]MCM2557083.1 IS630 family transposase [Chryseobacterium muglaense]